MQCYCSCSYLARRWAALEHRSAWLVVGAQVKAYSRETHSPSRASKTYGHNAFQIIHIRTTVINRGELASALAAAIILADAAVTPTVSKMT